LQQCATLKDAQLEWYEAVVHRERSLTGPGFQIPGKVDCRERKRIRFEI